MKKFRVYIFVLLVIMLINALPTFSSNAEEPGQATYKLVKTISTEVSDYEKQKFKLGLKDTLSLSAVDGKIAMHYKYEINAIIENFSNETTWGKMPQSIIPGEKVSVNASIATKDLDHPPAFTNFDFASGDVITEDNLSYTGGSNNLLRKRLTGPSQQELIEVVAPTSETYFIMTVWGNTTYFQVRITYIYKLANDKPVSFSGAVLNIYQQPMPYIKMLISPEYVEEGKSTKLPESLVETDIAGCFIWNGAVPVEAKGILKIRAEVIFECVVKDSATEIIGKNIFNMVNLKDTNSSSIKASTTISINPEDYKSAKEISVYRFLDFGFTSLNTPSLSFDDKSTPDEFDTNVINPKELATFSYLYCQLFSGLYTGVKTFKEREALITNATGLIVELNGPDADWSYFNSRAVPPKIRLCEKYTGTSDEARYTILHEFGHYFDWVTGGKKFHCTPTHSTQMNKNHGGYMNDVTSDSVLEGFASFYSCVSQKDGFFPENKPEIMGEFGSIANSSYPWVDYGIREEFSIARLFWSLKDILTIDTLWKSVLRHKSPDLYNYYFVIIKSARNIDEATVNKVKDAFYANGLYKLPAGNKTYDVGEPYINYTGGTSSWDRGEPFRDIPSSLPAIDYDKLKFGISSDDMKVRSSTFQLPNSNILLTGTIPQYVKVTITPETGETYAYIDKVANNTAYIGLPDYSDKGSITVDVPGGNQIYSGDIALLKEKIAKSWGQKVDLAEANVTGEVSTTLVRPVGGNASESGVYEVALSRMINPTTISVEQIPFFELSDQKLDEYRLAAQAVKTNNLSNDGVRSEEGSPSIILILAIILGVLTILVVTVIIVRKKGRGYTRRN